ncbi:MAG: thiosulfate oxidation carrier protein SoxY [Gammaproteobacteria bacterium]|nr:thiosulfate oxidation carrier protein SoxY [Gammaproteobacteria bacterium]
MQRRVFLKTSLLAAEYGLLTGAVLLLPRNVLGEWRTEVFHATVLDEAIKWVTGGQVVTRTEKIRLRVPAIVEDGRSVQVSIHSMLPGSDSISIFSERNPNPALGTFRLEPGLDPVIDTRIKMGGSGNVIALVHADGRFYSAKQYAKVTSGGCG